MFTIATDKGLQKIDPDVLAFLLVASDADTMELIDFIRSIKKYMKSDRPEEEFWGFYHHMTQEFIP